MMNEGFLSGLLRRVEELAAAVVDLALWPLVHVSYVDLPVVWTDDEDSELL